jgi:hypothetical protein
MVVYGHLETNWLREIMAKGYALPGERRMDGATS